MSSSEPPAAGKPTATPLDDKDEALLARFLAAGAQHLFEYPSKEEASGKKKIGGATPGWTGKRSIATTHDNSI